MTAGRTAEVGLIGGAGQQMELEDQEEVVVATPYGPTSVPVRTGILSGRRVAFIVRRGIDDVLQPHLVPYRANVWALAALGVRALVTTTAAGGLREPFAPGLFVVPDQLIDRTLHRDGTFYDEGPAVQLAAPDPYDATLRGLAIEALARQQVRHRDFGTAVVIEGPRFATRAESRWHAAAGGDLVNTTAMPETTLALELNVPVVNVSFITDSDAGVGADGLERAEVDLIRRRIKQAQPVLAKTVAEIVRTLPPGFRRTTGVPPAAVARVLARPTR